jgi:hypothetical protein
MQQGNQGHRHNSYSTDPALARIHAIRRSLAEYVQSRGTGAGAQVSLDAVDLMLERLITAHEMEPQHTQPDNRSKNPSCEVDIMGQVTPTPHAIGKGRRNQSSHRGIFSILIRDHLCSINYFFYRRRGSESTYTSGSSAQPRQAFTAKN